LAGRRAMTDHCGWPGRSTRMAGQRRRTRWSLARLGKAAAMAPAAWRGGLAGRRAWPGDSPPGGDR
jgi:hypothetical protein